MVREHFHSNTHFRFKLQFRASTGKCLRASVLNKHHFSHTGHSCSTSIQTEALLEALLRVLTVLV